jgi:hypothetical protein
MNKEQFERLPKYAQQRIKELEGENAWMHSALDSMINSQVESKIWTEEFDRTNISGPLIKRFFHADNLTIEHKGVCLSIDGLHNDDEDIRLSWCPAGGRYLTGTIAFVPIAHQQAKLSNLVYDEYEMTSLQRSKERHVPSD